MGWVLCPTRRTITAIIPFAQADSPHSHDAYHRFFRLGAWAISQLFHLWAGYLVSRFYPNGVLPLIADDTVHKKTGRQVNGAKYCRDAVRSCAHSVVYVWGLQFVPLCLRITPPWGGEPLAVPINLRLYRKNGPSLLDLVEEMLDEVAKWFPQRRFLLVADGFYAPLAGRLNSQTHLVSRMRADAAIYQLPPERKPGQHGRPRKKGQRLPPPAEIAQTTPAWKRVKTVERGVQRERLIHAEPVLWYHVAKDRPVLLVISRDPQGLEKDDFLFTTDLALDPPAAISEFANRWPVEDTFRNLKQFLGVEEPQSWKGQAPEKVAAFGYLLYGVIWAWYIDHAYSSTPLPSTPWYASKSTPSFKDALAALRSQLWHGRLNYTVLDEAHFDKMIQVLVHALSIAA